jgi:hypothetical protein
VGRFSGVIIRDRPVAERRSRPIASSILGVRDNLLKSFVLPEQAYPNHVSKCCRVYVELFKKVLSIFLEISLTNPERAIIIPIVEGGR